MLTPEQARDALTQPVREAKDLHLALHALAEPEGAIGWSLLGCDPAGNHVPFHEWDRRAALEEEALARLDTLGPAGRAAVWSAFLPRLDPALFERAWQSLHTAPYQSRYQRTPFRAPGAPSLTRRVRYEWLAAMAGTYWKYDPELEWLAAWAGHVNGGGDPAGPILASAIDLGGPRGEAVFQILRESAGGTHPIGTMGEHVLNALLGSGEPEAWAFVEKLLLAAQRQEGLRQSILGAILVAHPGAFRGMLRLILEHDLARFSATVHALDIWLGFGWDSASVKVVNATIERLLGHLEDPDVRAKALVSGGAEDAYLALWAIAFEDAPSAVEPAVTLLDDPEADRRFVAVHLLDELELEDLTLPASLKAVDDADLRVALRAVQAFNGGGDTGPAAASDLFERVERLIARVSAKPKPLAPIVWPWQALTADRGQLVDTLFNYTGDRPVARLARHRSIMNPGQRSLLARTAIERAADAPETRELLLELTSDPSASVRQFALEGLEKGRVSPDEAQRLEPLLMRKADDLRRGVLGLLAGQPDADALASADRLLAASKGESRRAGLELLRQLAEAGRCGAECHTRATGYRDSRPRLDAEELLQVEAILDTGRKVPTRDDAFGLIDDPASRTRPTPPSTRERTWLTPAALGCLRSLSALIHEHRDEKVALPNAFDENETTEELLGNIRWGFPSPNEKVPIAEDVVRLPLREIWEAWWQNRSAGLRDADGLELIRALAFPEFIPEVDDDDEDEIAQNQIRSWALPPKLAREVRAEFGSNGYNALPHGDLVTEVIGWLVKLHPPASGGVVDFLLDAVETEFSRVPADVIDPASSPGAKGRKTEEGNDEEDEDEDLPDWRESYRSGYTTWLSFTRGHGNRCGEAWTPRQHVRFYGLLRWMDEPGPAVPRHRPDLEELLLAFEAGGANEADLIDQLLGPTDGRHEWRSDLSNLTRRTPAEEFAEHPRLRPVVDRCRHRILEVELERGEAETAASTLALGLRSVWGTDTLLRLLRALGARAFDRSSGWQRTTGKAAVFSHLIRVAFPEPTDTPGAFAEEVARLAIPAVRLVELAVFAPQWARFVEHALGWPRFEEGVWWVHAHTKGSDWSVDEEIREIWTAEAAARTALSASDLVDGAVDVDWFHRINKALGADRWAMLDEAARYASGGSGHARARMFASAMLGKVKKAELAERVSSKRNADALRALGLLPLGRGASRARDVLDRYKTIQEFVRTSKQFGAQRQASEKRAAAIALDNLARTAGYPDPIRLEWAMEAKAVADLAEGPVAVDRDGVTVTLQLDDFGQAELTVTRAGKPLRSIPPAVKKHKEVATLVERKTELKRQASRVRGSLEAAMCRGDVFTGDELRQLAGHAVLWPLLSRLVLLGEGIAGYPAEGGRVLRGHDGKLEPVKPAERLRIAHPHDLLTLGDWHHWQHESFRAERVQPFKQVFRELYVLTEAEKLEATRSLRYAGHQVNPKQAMALLGGRGWVNHPEEGARKTFHEAGLTAALDVMGMTFSPADVEGITIESVHFVARGEWTPIPLEKVPPRLFSEVMRDLDLVVSVAHRGGVDPEASASTVEMRGSLLRETCDLLGLKNVRVNGAHAVVEGALGHYSLHLGSGVVHRQPGGALCIVPVHAQHRGRLFLPFADDDPKTAEVLSKALLLARDAEIQDPTILAQIRAAT